MGRPSMPAGKSRIYSGTTSNFLRLQRFGMSGRSGERRQDGAPTGYARDGFGKGCASLNRRGGDRGE
jgi:hypothetical protein